MASDFSVSTLADFDAFLGLMKTCAKLAISFWDYLGDRVGVAEAPTVARLAELIRRHATA